MFPAFGLNLVLVCSDLLCREVLIRILRTATADNVLCCQNYRAEINPKEVDLFCFLAVDVVAEQVTDLGVLWAYFHAAGNRVALIDFDRPSEWQTNPAVWNPLLDSFLSAANLFTTADVPLRKWQPSSCRYLRRSTAWFSMRRHAGIAPLVAKLRDRLYQLCDCLYDGEQWADLQPLLPGLSADLAHVLAWQEEVLDFYALLPDKSELQDWHDFFSCLRDLAENVNVKRSFQLGEGEALLMLIDKINKYLTVLRSNLYE